MADNTVKYIELAGQIHQRIKDGKYTGAMPGVHRLAEEYSVDPKTAWRAVDVLVAEGVLYRPNSRRTCVSRDAGDRPLGNTRRQPDRIHLLSNLSVTDGSADAFGRAFVAGLKSACKRRHVRHELAGVNRNSEDGPPPINDLPDNSWAVLLGGEVKAEELAHAGRRGVRMVFAGCSGVNGDRHSICLDWEGGLVSLIEELCREGHGGIAAVLPGDDGDSPHPLRAAWDVALARLHLNPSICPVLTVPEGGTATAEAVAALLAGDGDREAPTAVVSHMAPYATLKAGAALLGRRVPSQLSVVMVGEGRGASAPPRVARLSGDGRAMAEAAVETLFTYADKQAVVHIKLMPELRKGRSLTAAPQ